MDCARCDNEATHTEWTRHGKTSTIIHPHTGLPTGLCDECWDLYKKLETVETELLAMGLPMETVNAILIEMQRDMAAPEPSD